MTTKQFPVTFITGCGDQISVIRVEVSNIVMTNETASRLAKELTDAARFCNDGNSTTVWADVVTKQLPLYVGRALELIPGFGMGLVVTHGRACSHSPGPLLSSELRQLVANVSRHGWVWHPLAKKLVEARQED